MEINVKACGAIGNDGVDDTDAIRRAIEAAGDGDTVFFPAGTYCVQVTCDDLPTTDPARDPCCLVADVDFANYPGALPEGYRKQSLEAKAAFTLSRSGVTLAGEGPSSRIVCQAERKEPPRSDVERAWLFSIAGQERITFRKLAMESTGGLRDAFDVAIRIPNGTSVRQITIEECAFSGFRESAFASRGGRVGGGPADLSDLRITGCEIRNIGRMKDDHPGRSACIWSVGPTPGEELLDCNAAGSCQECRVVWGVGINANGWDRVYIAGNRIENVGSNRFDWGIYCNQTRFATVTQNSIVDCSGGIAWTGIDAVQGQEDVTIIGNSIDLERAAGTTDKEERFDGSRIGLQLRGGNETTPLQAHAIGNRLRWANIQCSTQNAVIAGNEVDLEDLHGTAGIWAGWGRWEARNVVVSANRVRAASIGTIDTTGILLSTASEIRVIGNHIVGATRGLALGVDHVTGASGGVRQALIAYNAITTADGQAFVLVNGAEDVEVTENTCVAADTITRGIQIGDTNVPQLNRDVWVHHNRLLGGPGIAFGLTAPLGGTTLPREIRIEENVADFRIVEMTPNCPPDSGYTVFKDGDVLRGNVLTPAGLTAALDERRDDCDRSEQLFGAANAARRPLRALLLDGSPAYAVLGGHEFSAPLGAPCPWTTIEVILDPATGLPQERCVPAVPDDARRIAFLSDGFAGQEITIHAQGAVSIVNATATEGNIRLKDPAPSLEMGTGDWLSLQLEPDRYWHERERGSAP